VLFHFSLHNASHGKRLILMTRCKVITDRNDGYTECDNLAMHVYRYHLPGCEYTFRYHEHQLDLMLDNFHELATGFIFPYTEIAI
jgi:hypothetical protein